MDVGYHGRADGARVSEVLGMIQFHVPGVPIPQGSKKSIPHKASGQFVMIDAHPGLKSWRKAVTQAAKAHVGTFSKHEPVALVAEFELPRPRSVRRDHPAVKPDLDKLTRALLDGITDAGVWVDDGQVVTASITKRYGDPGVSVLIYSLEVPF